MNWTRSLIFFLLPSAALLGAVLFFPLGYAVYLSLFDYYLADGEKHFIGLANYADLLSESRFWSSMGKTFVIVIGAVGLQFVVGLTLALALYRLTIRPKAFLVLNFLPHIITPVVGALFLRWMFVGRWGLIDATLASIGIYPPDWLGNPTMAVFTVIIADSWKFTPLIMLVLFAGLQSMDRNLLEAAVIDGASGWKLLWHIILPALKPLILFVLAIRTMDAFRFFDSIYVLTRGGPGTATETITIYTYQLGFRMLQIGKASALGVLTLLVIAGSVGAIMWIMYRKERGAF
ncbi:carbohydrate ABC transporter permease [Marivita sp.]|jgi:multiple sugar transport system permease protein|uniref:carbohydrate ABC transporter permease n=1 Tax=Marivita sp. TaxID=2003365 RepID=UPI003F6EAF74